MNQLRSKMHEVAFSPMNHSRITILGVLVVLATLVVFFTLQLNAAKRTEDPGKDRMPVGPVPMSPRPLPPYRLANTNQEEIPAGELSHGRVLLVYITTSCEPCVKEVKIISRLHTLNPQNLRIYGVSFERPAQVATFVKEFDLKFPVLIDMSSQLVRSLNIHYFPSTYLVEDGVITKEWRGVTLDEADLYRQLNVQ